MLTAHLKRGLAAGLLAGLVYGAYTVVVAAPLVAVAETFEAGGHTHASTVATLSGDAVTFTAGVAWGLLFGVLFGVAYYVLEPVLPDNGGYVLAGAGFLTVSGAPWLVLPPAAPGVKHTLGTDARLVVYTGMMLAGALAAAGTCLAYRWGRAYGRGAAAAAAALVPLAALLGITAFAPADPTTNPAPAAVTAAFRGVALVGQVGLWTLVAAVHARLASLTRDAQPVSEVDPIAAE